MVNNPIYPGFDWAQAFDFPDDFFQLGDSVRAEFRQFPKDIQAIASVSDSDGAIIEGNRLFIQLTAAKTVLMQRGAGYVVTNFVVMRGGDEIPVGVLVTIPVVLLPTRPQ